MKMRGITLAAALVAATTAYAEDLTLPMEDVDAPNYCGIYDPGVPGLKRSCMDMQQHSYDYLKSVWDHTSDEIKRRCLKTDSGKDIRIETPRYKYPVMEVCVSSYLYLDDLKIQRPFRR